MDQSFAFVGDNVLAPIWAGVGNENVTITNSFAGTAGNSVFCGGFWGNLSNNNYTSFVNNIDIKTYNSDDWVQFGAPLTPAITEIWMDNSDSTMGYNNQTYQNIRVEGNINVPLVQLKNFIYPWGGGPNPPLGNGNNITFSNITLEGTQKYLSEVTGLDANNGFHNVTFNNLNINGTHVTQANSGSYFATNTYVSNLIFDLPLPTASLTATPTSISLNASSTLSWTTTNATSVSINQGIGSVATSGSLSVSPATTTTYTLTATNATGATTTSATVTVIPPDTTPPVISNIATSSLTQISVTINWSTNEPADSQLQFNSPCPSGGCTTTLNSNLVTSHSVNVTGLATSTAYSYIIKSKDASGNLATSTLQTFTTLPNPPPAPPTNGLIGYWKLNEVSGTVASDTAASNNLTLVNGPAWSSGQLGGALSFDGSNDYANCSDAACGGTTGNKLDMGTRDFTVTAWVKPNASGNMYIASKIGDTEDGWFVSLNNLFVGAGIRAGGSGTEIFTPQTGSTTPLNTWSHITVVFNRAGNIVRYLNGVHTGTDVAINSRKNTTIDHPFNFCLSGRDVDGTGCKSPRYNGSLDDVRIYNRALTQQEITTIYNYNGIP